MLVKSISGDMSVTSDRLRPVNRYGAAEKSGVSFGFKMGPRQREYKGLLKFLKKMAFGTMYFCGEAWRASLRIFKSMRKSSSSVGEFLDEVKGFWSFITHKKLDF